MLTDRRCGVHQVPWERSLATDTRVLRGPAIILHCVRVLGTIVVETGRGVWGMDEFKELYNA